jgi:glycosyltransferase involved in cell wall biosynthesis
MQDPLHPMYNFVRDVDYVSGCAFMMERKLFLSTGSFDETLSHGYYEDTSKCMELRALGKRVLYQPFSQIVHFEGVSHGKDVNSGIKMYQEKNKEIFVKKFRSQLKSHLPHGRRPDIASDRTVQGHILIVDAVTPTPDQDSGSIDMFNLIRIFIAFGYRVHFIPMTNFAHFGKYTANLQRMGVECIYAPFYTSVEGFLKERGDIFDYVILSRSEVAVPCWRTIEKLAPGAFKIFYTVDLHFLREEREAAHQKDVGLARTAAQRRRDELSIIGWADTTIVLSEHERKILDEQGYGGVEVWPLIRELPASCGNAFADRSGVVFIGGFQHTPNVDAVKWLVDDIWPEVRRICSARGLAPIELRIVGSKMPGWFHDLQFDDIRFVGFVEDLDEVFDNARLSIAPLRYGAGLKGKVATSLGYGVPAIGSHIAFEGMPADGLEEVIVLANSASELAKAVVDVYEDEERWRAIAARAPSYIDRHFSIEAVADRVGRLLERTRKRVARDHTGEYAVATLGDSR